MMSGIRFAGVYRLESYQNKTEGYQRRLSLDEDMLSSDEARDERDRMRVNEIIETQQGGVIVPSEFGDDCWIVDDEDGDDYTQFRQQTEALDDTFQKQAEGLSEKERVRLFRDYDCHLEEIIDSYVERALPMDVEYLTHPQTGDIAGLQLTITV